MKIQEVKPSGVEGLLLIKNNRLPKNQMKRMEIPFERMADAKKNKFNPALTVGVILVPLVVITIMYANSDFFGGSTIPIL